MSIASTIRWRRRRALLIPKIVGGTAGKADRRQRYVMVIWLGCVVQVAFARPRGFF